MNCEIGNCKGMAFALQEKFGGYVWIRKTRHPHKWRLLAKIGIKQAEYHYGWQPENDCTRSCKNKVSFVPKEEFKGFKKYFPPFLFRGKFKRGDD